jgi:hypothetical protein
MYLAIIILPLLGSIVSGFFGRKVGVSGAQLITCSCVIVTTLLAIVAFFEVGLNNIPVSIHLFRWIDSESLNVSWGFHFDSLTVSMLIPVLIVSSLVHIYSIGYMSHDPHNQRFFSYLSLFTFMMIILVTANNFLLMFVGWEGVGVCSYLLVSFWFTRIAANQSSMSAFLTNRVGDCFLTIGMFAILWSFGNIDYSTVFSLAPFVNENIVTIIGICLLIGAMAKSSQVGLHVWLPMAMEGPTPVSALIHAATMVTAGVYLLMRTSPLIEYSSTVLILCLWLGAITTVFSSLIGLFQQDIKKVIAYSTMSQLARECINIFSMFRHQTICESTFLRFSIKKCWITTHPKLNMYSTLNYKFEGLSTDNHILNPYFVTGFTDAEGCFLINIQKRSDLILGYSISLSFKIKLHLKDKELLENISNFFNVGKVYLRKDGYVDYIVNSMKDIEVIINHFNNYPLITQKLSDYKLFKLVFEYIKKREHLTKKGFIEILSLKASFNIGLTEELKIVFPNIIASLRPQTITPKLKTIDPHWVSGFVDGDGCFYISLTNNSTGVGLVFKITQHRDTDLLKEFVNYFNCGRYSLSSPEAGDFIVTKFQDIYTKIIPFFSKYTLKGSKSLDFYAFNRAAELIVNKAHLTSEGFESIKQIKSGTNEKRRTKSIITNVQKRTYVTTKICNNTTSQDFNEWLSGLIDGDGQFFVSKKGYANFKIVMKKEDTLALNSLKQKFGGSIKEISSGLKYKLAHKKGLIKLVNNVNGLIRNPSKMLQLDKVCKLYGVKFETSKPLIYYNGWFSGFMDADGSIFYNDKSDQLVISITQKNKYLLDSLLILYSGRIEIIDSRQAFQYSIYRKQEILSIIDNYFKRFPLMSNKRKKIDLIKKLYEEKSGSVEKIHLIEKINYK